MCGILSGNGILQKAVVVNVFKKVVDAIQGFYKSLDNQFKTKLHYSRNQTGMQGICFSDKLNSSSNTDTRMISIKDIMENLNCCQELAVEIESIYSLLVLFKYLTKATQYNSGFISCNNENCRKCHIYTFSKVKIDCKKKGDLIREMNPDIHKKIKLIITPLLDYNLRKDNLVIKCLETILCHVQKCNLSTKNNKDIIEIIWGVVSCMEACPLILDIHMYVVLLYHASWRERKNGNNIFCFCCEADDPTLLMDLKSSKFYCREKKAFFYGQVKEKTENPYKKRKTMSYFDKINEINKHSQSFRQTKITSFFDKVNEITRQSSDENCYGGVYIIDLVYCITRCLKTKMKNVVRGTTQEEI